MNEVMNECYKHQITMKKKKKNDSDTVGSCDHYSTQQKLKMYLTIFVSFFFNNIVQELPNGWNIISTCIMSFRIMVEYFLFIFFFLSSSRISTSFFFFFFWTQHEHLQMRFSQSISKRPSAARITSITWHKSLLC